MTVGTGRQPLLIKKNVRKSVSSVDEALPRAIRWLQITDTPKGADPEGRRASRRRCVSV
jgi:hypothetical protein